MPGSWQLAPEREDLAGPRKGSPQTSSTFHCSCTPAFCRGGNSDFPDTPPFGYKPKTPSTTPEPSLGKSHPPISKCRSPGVPPTAAGVGSQGHCQPQGPWDIIIVNTRHPCTCQALLQVTKGNPQEAKEPICITGREPEPRCEPNFCLCGLRTLASRQSCAGERSMP